MDVFENISVTIDTTRLREKFIQGLNGTTMGEVILYASQFPLLAFVAISLELIISNMLKTYPTKIARRNILSALFVCLFEILIIVVPVTVMFTLLSDYIYIFFLSLIGIITVIVTSSVSHVDDQILYWKFTNLKQILSSETTYSKKQLFITYFRSFVLLVTAVSILGVDFHIFPRRFAKTETYGVSLMDLGVGLFVISNALVEKRSLSVTELKKTLLSSFVLIILGILRCLMVQRLNYQMHVTEYGRDWNFFFTLAFVKLLSSILLIVIKGHSLVSGLILIVVHQYLLSHSLQSLALSNKERDEWFSANREGIISLSGYLSIHLMGITIANFVNPVDKPPLVKNKLKAIIVFSIISALLFCILYYFDTADFKVSRRLANLPYVFWVIAISLELLVLFLIVELMSCWLLPIALKMRNDLYSFLIPVLLESINCNGLIFFLLSNFLTGLVNLNVDAFSSSTLKSSLILLSYMFVDCAVVFMLYTFNIRFKF